MYANEIEKILAKNSFVFEKFKGFFARNELPTTLDEGSFYIGNTE